MPEIKIGRITHFFAKVGVAIIEATDGEVAVGDQIHIKGHTTDLTQTIQSLQIEHQPVTRLEKGQSAGLKTDVRVHEHDEVFKVTA